MSVMVTDACRLVDALLDEPGGVWLDEFIVNTAATRADGNYPHSLHDDVKTDR